MAPLNSIWAIALCGMIIPVNGHSDVSMIPSPMTGDVTTVADNVPAPPAIAASVGYNQNTFGTSAFAASNVDMGGTFAPGFQWYLFNFFGSPPTAANIAINGDGSITVGQGGNNYNATLSSAAQIRGTPGFVGTAFGGGAYIEAVVRFNAQPFRITNGFPAFWANALESNLRATQWPGQAIGYGHAIEADILEYYQAGFSNPLNQYSASLIDWYGSGKKYGVGTAYTVPQASFANYNTVAMLWVPATGATDGYVNFYWNGSLVRTQHYTQLSSADQPPPSASTPWAFGIIDRQHLTIETGSNSTYPITIQSVNVWQPNANANMHN